MKKKLIMIITACLAATVFSTAAIADENLGTEPVIIETEDVKENTAQSVEVSFTVGDDIIVINGEEVITETAPYVVETATGGVTLVPVRVITEAFGAEVSWDEASQTVTLSYPDVEILLQIGNKVAEVNGEAVELLAAPELPGGRTMVPLRFISETFGADVSYNEETGLITVTKSDGGEGGTVVSGIDNKYIGDSDMGWMMLNPKELVLYTRSEDGTYTVFLDESYNTLTIDFYEKAEDLDFEEYFKDTKKSEGEYATLSKADVDAEKGVMHFQSRTTAYFNDIRIFVTDEYVIYLESEITADDADAKEYFLEIADSFQLSFGDSDIHDLYTPGEEVDESVFESEELGFKIKFPANFDSYDDGYGINHFQFYGNGADSVTSLNIEIISKDNAAITPEEYLKNFKENMSEGINEKLVTVGEITTQKLFGVDALVFDYVIEGTKFGNLDKSVKWILFEKGMYAYRIRIDIDAQDENADSAMSELVDGMEFNEIDFDTVGIILDSYEVEENEAYTTQIGRHTIDLPEFAIEYGYGLSYNYYANFSKIDFEIECEVMPLGYTLEDAMNREILECELSCAEDESSYKIYDVEEITLGENKFLKVSFEAWDEEGWNVSLDMYVCEVDGYLFTVTSYVDELVADFCVENVEKILSTLKKAEVKPVEEAEE